MARNSLASRLSSWLSSCAQNITTAPLTAARTKLYQLSDGSLESGNVNTAHIDTEGRIQYFHSRQFRDWVASERALGREVFWLKDVDMTQAAGDVFSSFFQWRCSKNSFSIEQQRIIAENLKPLPSRYCRALTPFEVVRLWREKEAGRDGITLLDLWLKYYWPSQTGLHINDKLQQVNAYAEEIYPDKVYPFVPEENHVLAEAGVHVVIVSNGDEELAKAVAPILGINPENVVGSPLQYGADGLGTGANHSYESFAEEWADKPQPGKVLNFHYWLHKNRQRFGWDHVSESKFVIAGRDGDSASADGGMMILLPPAAIGNFMVDTPGEPHRIEKFKSLAAKYAWTKGQFFTLHQLPSKADKFA